MTAIIARDTGLAIPVIFHFLRQFPHRNMTKIRALLCRRKVVRNWSGSCAGSESGEEFVVIFKPDSLLF